MDPMIVQVLLGVASLVGGFFLRHYTLPGGPAAPTVPSVPSKHPILDAIGPEVLAVLAAALQNRAVAQGHSELTDLLAHAAPPAPAAPK